MYTNKDIFLLHALIIGSIRNRKEYLISHRNIQYVLYTVHTVTSYYITNIYNTPLMLKLSPCNSIFVSANWPNDCFFRKKLTCWLVVIYCFVRIRPADWSWHGRFSNIFFWVYIVCCIIKENQDLLAKIIQYIHNSKPGGIYILLLCLHTYIYIYIYIS